MKEAKNAALLEAVLFLEIEPLSKAQLSRITGLDISEITKALKTLSLLFSGKDHGLELTQIADGWTFSPKEQYWDVLKDRYGKKNEDFLSRAALETLSIIAYSQPLTRVEIDNMRGVGSDGMIRVLKEKDLIKEVGRKETPGRPVLYGTTRNFLKIFRLKSIGDLPKLEEMDEKRFASDGEK